MCLMQVLVQMLIGLLLFDEDSIFITAQFALSLIAVVLLVVILIFGNNPGHEKGCIMQGIHSWVCYVIGVCSLLTALNGFVKLWGKYRQKMSKKSEKRTPLLPLS